MTAPEPYPAAEMKRLRLAAPLVRSVAPTIAADIPPIVAYVDQSRALLEECCNEIGNRVLTPDERVALIARIGETIGEK